MNLVTLLLFAGTLPGIARSRTDFIIENALLRQQMIFLNRQVKRPQLTHPDRFLLILLARCTGFWKQALHIVQPDILLRWHWELFRFYWQRKPRHKQYRPKILFKTIELIRKMAKETLMGQIGSVANY